MLANSLKRKLDEDGLDEDWRPVAVCNRPQRQMVLEMSLMKLYGPRMGHHLALQHRVLIGNVVRRIYADFRREEGVGPFFFSAASLTDSYRPPPPSSISVFSPSQSTPDSCPTPASELGEDPLFPLPPLSTTSPSSSSTLSLLPAQLSFGVVVKEEEESTIEKPPSSFLMDFTLDDDLFRSLSGYNAAGVGTQNQPFKMDLAELDHIMEVLVGS